MTNEQINIAIAELTGLDVIHDPAGPKDRSEAWKTGFFTPKAAKQRRISWPSSAVIKVVPDYCNDLNAMHEAEKMLNSEQWVAYGKELSRLGVFPMVHANAKERTEAFLRTFEKWKD